MVVLGLRNDQGEVCKMVAVCLLRTKLDGDVVAIPWHCIHRIVGRKYTIKQCTLSYLTHTLISYTYSSPLQVL